MHRHIRHLLYSLRQRYDQQIGGRTVVADLSVVDAECNWSGIAQCIHADIPLRTSSASSYRLEKMVEVKVNMPTAWNVISNTDSLVTIPTKCLILSRSQPKRSGPIWPGGRQVRPPNIDKKNQRWEKS